MSVSYLLFVNIHKKPKSFFYLLKKKITFVLSNSKITKNMRTLKNLFLFAIFSLMAGNAFAQGTVKGTVLEAKSNDPLPGADVVLVGTTTGVATDFDGNFVLKVPAGTQKIQISSVGYATKVMTVTVNNGQVTNLGKIAMAEDAQSLSEVVIVGKGIVDLAKDRKTPIAVSTIKAAEIQEKGGNFDLPELLTETPSVQTSKEGGYGDGRISIRGFDQTNTAFLLNGQPINGMEDGKMYWSNWSGILDIANALQVQRGLGSSKLAISSVGGTVNIITKTVDKKQGGFVSLMAANDSYMKGTAYYSTGLMKNGLAVSAMFGHWQGEGYRNGTAGQGQTYFFSVGYKPNEKNIFNFLVTGAPQWHGDAWTVDLQTYLDKGRKFNNMYGTKDGEIYPGARNFYHKPIINLSWDWKIKDNMNLSSVLYGSLGRGGYAYPTGALWGKKSGEDGGIDFDAQVAENNAAGEAKGYMRGSYNGHNWYGFLTNLELNVNDNVSVNFGGDVRMYNGIHFRAPTDLLGDNGINVTHNGETYVVDNVFGGYNPWGAVTNFNNDHKQRVARDYSEVINYYGVFGQIEYSKDKFSTFFQGAVSNQDHQRTEYWNTPAPEESEKVSNMGYNAKAGFAYQINKGSNVFVNAGYYSRQPFHDDLFVNGSKSNELNNPQTGNESILGYELGYNKKGENYNFNVNLYNTEWGNRTRRNSNRGTNTYNVYTGVSEIHKGIELDGSYRPIKSISLKAFFSYGDWKYSGNAQGKTYDENGNDVTPGGTQLELDLDGKYVRGAQITAGGFVDYKITPAFKISLGQRFYGKNHGNLSNVAGAEGAIYLPGYSLTDAGLSYKLKLKNKSTVSFRLNVNNIFDKFYISSANGNTPVTSASANVWHGVDTSNNVRIGYGRTWNFGVRYKF